MGARSHAPGDYEVYAAFLKPWRQEPWLMLGSRHLCRPCRCPGSLIDVYEGESLAVPEVLGKPSIGYGDGNSHCFFVLSVGTVELRVEGGEISVAGALHQSHRSRV